VLSDFHTEKAHVIVKLFADGELSGFCQEFSEQPRWTHLEVLAHRYQQAFLTVILFVRPFHFKEAVGKHDNQITRSNRRQARLISGLLKQTEGRTKTAVAQCADVFIVIVHGRFSGFGAPANWIATDIVRIENGILVEHWDVIQDEATRESSKSGLPMFGEKFGRSVQTNSKG
jgi:predicted SnoaL-like aldol condensation-catalyzing enzyme